MGDEGHVYEHGRDYAGGFSPLGKGKGLGYPPVNIPPVKPIPFDTFSGQFPLSVALRKGTLFKWLYDPYHDPYEDGDSSSSSDWD
ncbi:MAG: spore coat associated protein CotJA [Bacillaceae bacterium]|nr:spore coat associated protein CotJA [Bacillaceae bacterium]